MPIIDRFDRGLVTGVDKVYLDPGEASILLDVNIEEIGLKSALKCKVIGQAKKSFYQFPILDSEPEAFHVTSSNNKRSYAEFQGSLCYSDGGPACQITQGDIDPDTEDFKWYDMGIDAVDGDIVATAIILDDIAGASATLNAGSQAGDGYIQGEHIRYRIVDADGVVYIHSIENNPGHSTVDWVLPSTDYSVYREILDSWGGYTDNYLKIGEGSFTDGTVPITDEFTFKGSEEIADFSGHRLSAVGSSMYTLSYNIVITTEVITLVIDRLLAMTEDGSWTTMSLNTGIESNDIDIAQGVASTFVHNDNLYIMYYLNGKFKIDRVTVSSSTATTQNIVDVPLAVGSEYFKGTTVEYDGIVYMFNLLEGKVGTFDGTTFILRDITVFPYAMAEDTVLALREGTNEIYAIINDRYEATIRKISLPSLEIDYTGVERMSVNVIRGLGGTSGSNFNDGDYILFPIHNGIIKFSPSTNMIVNNMSSGPSLPTETDRKCFFIDPSKTTDFIWSLYSEPIIDKAILSGWSWNEDTIVLDPVWFNERVITGTVVYNVSQRTADDLSDGPIMATESQPVGIHKGHIKVNLSGINHTYPLRLYRTGGYLTRFTMVEDVDPGVEYIDKRDDVTIALGRNGEMAFVSAPPEGIKWLTEHKGMLFGVVGTKLYWSQPGNAHKWDIEYSYIIVDREITGLASVVNGLIIFMKGRTKILTGADRTSFALKTISNDKGTIDGDSIQDLANGAVFFSEDGLCFTDGAQIGELSYSILGKQKFDSITSTSTTRSYYALLKGFTNSALNSSRVMLRYDIGKAPVFSLLSADEVEGLGIINGKLAHSSAGILYDTLSESYRVMNYRSGNITEGAPTIIKEWDRVRIQGTFKGTFIIYIDEVIKVSKEIDIDITNIGNFHIPKKDCKGKSIAFELKGIGLVSSIEYSLTDRKVTK